MSPMTPDCSLVKRKGLTSTSDSPLDSSLEKIEKTALIADDHQGLR